MFLTYDEEEMLKGEHGEAAERCMRLLVRLGEVFGALNMVPIKSAQVAGVSYKSIGDPGLGFIRDFADMGAKVKVLTTLNPAGMDLKAGRKLGFSKGFAEKQEQIIDAYSRMGITPTVTCTPYYCGNLPRKGDHISWAESSAVSFANSVLGARTNREGGPSSLASAICGVTPNHGLHLDENRKAGVVIDVKARLKSYSDYGALGYWVGKQVGSAIPLFKGLGNASQDNLKGLGASMAASGAVALYHVKGVTPEADKQSATGLEKLTFTDSDMRSALRTLNTGRDPDILIFGCPHSSIKQIEEIADALNGMKLKKQLWVCCARAVKEEARKLGYVGTIEEAGGHVVADTCMVVAPIETLGFSTTAVDSGKAANYLPGFCEQSVVFSDVRSLIREALE